MKLAAEMSGGLATHLQFCAFCLLARYSLEDSGLAGSVFPHSSLKVPLLIDYPANQQKRQLLRSPCDSAIVIAAGNAGIRFGRLCDLSDCGLGITCDVPVVKGAVIQIHVPNFKPGLIKFLLAKVKHVTAHEGARWILGCELAEPMNCEEITALRSREEIEFSEAREP